MAGAHGGGERLLWIGTYTPGSEPEGGGAGAYPVLLDTATGRLRAGGPPRPAVGPSFLAAAPGGIVAVAERPAGGLAFLAGGPEGTGGADASGSADWAAETGGTAPCHVLVHPAGRHAVAAHYGDGSVTVHSLGGPGAGAVAARIAAAAPGSGGVPDRQEGPHAHSTVLAPGGRHLLIADLGADALYSVPFDASAAEPAGPPAVAIRLPDGTGPRHCAVHPDGRVFVAGELDARVHALAFDPGSGTARPLGAAPAGEPGAAFPGEILLSPDGRRLTVSLRGPDTVAVFDVADGALRRVGAAPTGGAWPRHIARAGSFLVAANQYSGTVTALPIDPDTGVPGPPAAEFAVPDPACVLPL
ncbi:lactonase family protein [Nocardiopsis coralliicola]